jgi:hypothetical protein
MKSERARHYEAIALLFFVLGMVFQIIIDLGNDLAKAPFTP